MGKTITAINSTVVSLIADPRILTAEIFPAVITPEYSKTTAQLRLKLFWQGMESGHQLRP